MGNKVTEKNVKLKPVSQMKSRNVDEIVILPEKAREIPNELKQVLYYRNTTKCLNY